MSNGTSESEASLQKILEFTRFGSIIILLLHFYYFCYDAFAGWKISSKISDRFFYSIEKTGLFNELNAKLIALGLLIISLIGSKGRKDEKIKLRDIIFYLAIGLLFYFSSNVFLKLDEPEETIAIIYMSATGLGYLLILAGGALLSRLIKIKLGADVFNEINETFPQEERLLKMNIR